ncbi:MAG: hypothetical protein IJT68_05765 [Lentisphaeria bacterium]|nr:hypothetical protein [Lentisphaeria bacterium]MBR3506188.1 hypothetical protein [Lentisphaeria bacterium]
MNIKVPLYIVSFILAVIGLPILLVMIYLSLIDAGISSKFLWVLSIACCVLSILLLVLGHLLTVWAEEDEMEE